MATHIDERVFPASYHDMHSNHAAQPASNLNQDPLNFLPPYSPSQHGHNFRYHQRSTRTQSVQRANVGTGIPSQSLNYMPPNSSNSALLSNSHNLLESGANASLSQYLPPLSNFIREPASQHESSHSRLPLGHASGMRHASPSLQLRPPATVPLNNSPTQVEHPHFAPSKPDHKLPPTAVSEVPNNPPASMVAGSVKPPKKEISNLVIACRQCRGRKIRCDSNRPICHNCARRSNVCEYDAVPKRRGPDKRPGTRQRSCKKRPADGTPAPSSKRRRTTGPVEDPSPPAPRSNLRKNKVSHDERSSSLKGQGNEAGSRIPPAAKPLSSSPIDAPFPELTIIPNTSSAWHSSERRRRSTNFSSPLTPLTPHSSTVSPRVFNHRILSPPTKDDRVDWWNCFLATHTLSEIEHHMRHLIKETGRTLTFLNVDFVLKRLHNEGERIHVQPAFVLSILAMSTFMRSSEMEYKAPGREQAIQLRNSAQEHLQDSWSKGWVDTTLAEAALILALYETSAHKSYSPSRINAALLFLDNIIQRLNLMKIDRHDQQIYLFSPGSVPVIHLEPVSAPDSTCTISGPNYIAATSKRCSCILPRMAHPEDKHTTRSYSLPWSPDWSDSDAFNEECRRLCWSALGLVCVYVSQCVAFESSLPTFALTDASNYALLFPGEVLDRQSSSYNAADSMSTKESVWALYCRSMLLWAFTNRLRSNLKNSDEQVDIVYEVLNEAQSIQDSLEMHECNLDTELIYMTQEYILNTRIAMTYALRSLLGFGNGSPFKRKDAEDWLCYQDRVLQPVQTAIKHLGTPRGHYLARCPQSVSWFSGQLSICLLLWNHDHALKQALTLGKSMLFVLEVLNILWPSDLLKHQAYQLRDRLTSACKTVGIDLPTPLTYVLPSSKDKY